MNTEKEARQYIENQNEKLKQVKVHLESSKSALRRDQPSAPAAVLEEFDRSIAECQAQIDRQIDMGEHILRENIPFRAGLE